MDVGRLARSVESEADHVDPVELGEWIKDRKRGLRVIDVRTRAAYDEYHIPTAEWIPLTTLATTAFTADETVVLYSEGGAHAAQGWVFLQLAGHRNSYFVRGGVLDWLEDVMEPRLMPGADEATTKQYRRASALSRYFGGQPVRATGSEAGMVDGNTVQSLVRKRKKRSC